MKEKTKKILGYIVTCVCAGIVGGLIVKKFADIDLNNQKDSLMKAAEAANNTTKTAKNMIEDISSKVNDAVSLVYKTEAKKALNDKLASLFQDIEITEMIEESVQNNVNDALEEAANSYLEDFDVDETIKDYLDDNWKHFYPIIESKVDSAVKTKIDDEFTQTVKDAFAKVITNAVN